ncbi:hypothetical protein HYPSUDRAFT_54618 [Hypholoma sublateritium FD-334 SS-4]|uniref:Uncharacterized protein n=1 Tax=Hypholoma sublateritium (strain FD-334 SS-4) TaxID=945553 RepID=A0A0D2NVY0_HYPSF|nr:hypothetical protein HYPSUDRAFT_54618 [Hypholoma sublateritium FD-334 SS-4]
MSESFENIFASLKMFYTRRHYCFYTHDGFTGDGSQCIGNPYTRSRFRHEIVKIIFIHQREFREIFEVGATEKFARYKLAVSADPHSTGTDPRPHWTVRLYDALDVHVATMHIDRLWAYSIEKTTAYYDFYEKLIEENGSEVLVTTKLCFCHGCAWWKIQTERQRKREGGGARAYASTSWASSRTDVTPMHGVTTSGMMGGRVEVDVESKECWVNVYRVKSDARADSMLETKSARATAAAWVERCGPLKEHPRAQSRVAREVERAKMASDERSRKEEEQQEERGKGRRSESSREALGERFIREMDCEQAM